MLAAALLAALAAPAQPAATTILTVPASHRLIAGIASDGETIWLSSVVDREILAWRPHQALRIRHMPPDTARPLGLAWDAKRRWLWVATDCPEIAAADACTGGGLIALDRAARLVRHWPGSVDLGLVGADERAPGVEIVEEQRPRHAAGIEVEVALDAGVTVLVDIGAAETVRLVPLVHVADRHLGALEAGIELDGCALHVVGAAIEQHEELRAADTAGDHRIAGFVLGNLRAIAVALQDALDLDRIGRHERLRLCRRGRGHGQGECCSGGEAVDWIHDIPPVDYIAV